MLNATASRNAKLAGQQLALEMSGDWKRNVLVELRAWLAVHRGQGNTTMTFEQFRAQAVNQPASHKAWGGLAVMACNAGLIAPMTHDDGSPVMRRAESVRTHAHPVRLWKIVDASFVPPPAAGGNTPRLDDQPHPVVRHQPMATTRVGDVGPAVTREAC